MMTSAIVVRGDQRFQLVDLAGAEQRRRARVGHRHEHAVDDIEVDRLGKAGRLPQAILRRVQRRRPRRAALLVSAGARRPFQIRNEHEGARTACTPLILRLSMSVVMSTRSSICAVRG